MSKKSVCVLVAALLSVSTVGKLSPVALAQTSDNSTKNEALSLLDKSAAAYVALEGLSMRTSYYVEGGLEKEGEILRGTTTLAFEKSGRARITLSVAPDPQIISERAKDVASAKLAIARAVEFGAPGAQLPLKALVQGKNPLRQKSGTVMGDTFFGKNARLLPDNGVAIAITRADEPQESPLELTMYFDPNDYLLRRVDTKGSYNGERVFHSTVFSDVQINPQFAPDTFAAVVPIKWDPKLQVGAEPFPITGTDLNGKAHDLKEYQGKVVLLDFWATWCGPCIRELPGVLSSYAKYHPQGFEVVGISLDQNKKDLTNFIAARKMPWPQLFDGKVDKDQNAQRYGLKAIPFTLLIGKDGKIAAVNPRGATLEPAIKAALTK